MISLGRLLGSIWEVLGALGGVLDPQRGSLGGPEGLQELNLEALGAQLGGPKRSKMPTWWPKALLRAQLGGPKPSQELILKASNAPRCQFGAQRLGFGGPKHLRNESSDD